MCVVTCYRVSIPSNGSIQFLLKVNPAVLNGFDSLNPLKRVNSILTPLTKDIFYMPSMCLNPLKRVNSILTDPYWKDFEQYMKGLNPLKRVNSILTKYAWSGAEYGWNSLNPLKRVNSILTVGFDISYKSIYIESQSPQTGQFNSYGYSL